MNLQIRSTADLMRKPAQTQAISLSWIGVKVRLLCYTLAQKGDPDREFIECQYHLCQNDVEKEKAVKSRLHFRSGTMWLSEERLYCCDRCAECDQMANEP
ncbi:MULTISPECIES: YdaE family protein [Enterobacterales]|uniref:YdaE family protein n=1 Tax=Enterobacterales TaxID=91347 RepID=UPI002ED8FFBF